MPSQISLLDSLLETPKPQTVTEFTAEVRELLERRFAQVWIEGEVSNFKRHSSGHWYFTLKDDAAQVRCASFRTYNRYIRFAPDDGLAVRIRGRISLYEPRGEYQVLVTSIEPVGIGALQLAFDQLKARLDAEGLFAVERKRAIPLLPRRVGIVTSRTGAVLRDMLRVLGRRNRSVSVLIAPVRVQGDGAGSAIARAIRMLAERMSVDVIIVGRGGGTLEDLWAFNEEVVARAIATCGVPVISAVGHETDFTIADFVADLRAPTPSAAAELVAAVAEELSTAIGRLRHAAASATRYRLLSARNVVRGLRYDPAIAAVPGRITSLVQSTDEARELMVTLTRHAMLVLGERATNASKTIRAHDPRARIASERSTVAAARSLATVAGRAAIHARRALVAKAGGTLAALSPLDVLLRGYAIVRDARGAIVRSADQVAAGDEISIRVHDGELRARRVPDA